jgi:hypothetical protein
VQIHSFANVERHAIDPCHLQHLPDQPSHAVDILPQMLCLSVILQRIDARHKHGKWSAQRVCCVADEASLRYEC